LLTIRMFKEINNNVEEMLNPFSTDGELLPRSADGKFYQYRISSSIDVGQLFEKQFLMYSQYAGKFCIQFILKYATELPDQTTTAQLANTLAAINIQPASTISSVQPATNIVYHKYN